MHKNFIQYQDTRPTEAELRFYENWTFIRKAPKWKYILINGIFKEGLFFFIIIKLIQYLFFSIESQFFYSSLAGIIFLIFEIFFWFMGGFVVGWFKYNSKEIEYEILKNIIE